MTFPIGPRSPAWPGPDSFSGRTVETPGADSRNHRRQVVACEPEDSRSSLHGTEGRCFWTTSRDARASRNAANSLLAQATIRVLLRSSPSPVWPSARAVPATRDEARCLRADTRTQSSAVHQKQEQHMRRAVESVAVRRTLLSVA